MRKLFFSILLMGSFLIAVASHAETNAHATKAATRPGPAGCWLYGRYWYPFGTRLSFRSGGGYVVKVCSVNGQFYPELQATAQPTRQFTFLRAMPRGRSDAEDESQDTYSAGTIGLGANVRAYTNQGYRYGNQAPSHSEPAPEYTDDGGTIGLN